MRIKSSFIVRSSISEACRDFLAKNQKVRFNPDYLMDDGIYERSTNEKQWGIKGIELILTEREYYLKHCNKESWLLFLAINFGDLYWWYKCFGRSFRPRSLHQYSKVCHWNFCLPSGCWLLLEKKFLKPSAYKREKNTSQKLWNDLSFIC